MRSIKKGAEPRALIEWKRENRNTPHNLYYGKGSRAYVMMKWDLTRGVDLWLRYAQWVYEDRTTISSGNTAIDGNKKGDVTVQLRWQF